MIMEAEYIAELYEPKKPVKELIFTPNKYMQVYIPEIFFYEICWLAANQSQSTRSVRSNGEYLSYGKSKQEAAATNALEC